MSANRYAVMEGRTECTADGHTVRLLIIMFAVIAAAVLAAAIVSSGSDCSSAEITDDWSYDSNTKVLTYSGPVKMPDYSSSDNPISRLNASDAQSVTFVTSVLNIGDFTFRGSSLHEVVLPSSTLSIGKGSFVECSDLKTVTFPSGLVNIGSYAFQSCTMLGSVSLPSSVGNIGQSAFENCTSLKSVLLPDHAGVSDDATLVIRNRVFSGCSALEKILIPSHVTDVESYAFCGCSALYSIVFEEKENVDEKGKVISYISKIRYIGDYAFMDCTSVRTITVPEGLETMGKDIFKGTSKLESIETRPTSTHYRSSDGVLFSLALDALYHYPSAKADMTYIIPSSVISIDNTAFNGAKNLESISIGTSLLYYSENGVLYDLLMTKIIRYPEGRTDQSFTIPGSITAVCENAFNGATKLKELTINDSKVKFEENSLCLGSFGDTVTLRVHVPSDYKIPESAYNSYTVMNYGEKDDSLLKVANNVIVAGLIAVLVIAIIVAAALAMKKKSA